MYTYLKAASTFSNDSRIFFLSAQLGGVTCELLGAVTATPWRLWVWLHGICWLTDNGLAKGTTGHVSLMERAWGF